MDVSKEMDRRTVAHAPESLQVPVGVFQQHPELAPQVEDVLNVEHCSENWRSSRLSYCGTGSSIFASSRS